jgi:hypothetical protein
MSAITITKMTRAPSQHDRSFRKNRAAFKQRCKQVRAPCARCHGELGPIDYDCEPQLPRAFELGHIQDVASRPDLFYVEANWQPEHSACNRSAQAIAKKNKRAQHQHAQRTVESGRWVRPTF